MVSTREIKIYSLLNLSWWNFLLLNELNLNFLLTIFNSTRSTFPSYHIRENSILDNLWYGNMQYLKEIQKEETLKLYFDYSALTCLMQCYLYLITNEALVINSQRNKFASIKIKYSGIFLFFHRLYLKFLFWEYFKLILWV